MYYIYNKSKGRYSLMAAVEATSVAEANDSMRRMLIEQFGSTGGKRVWRDAKRQIALYSNRRLETGEAESLVSSSLLTPNPKLIEH